MESQSDEMRGRKRKSEPNESSNASNEPRATQSGEGSTARHQLWGSILQKRPEPGEVADAELAEWGVGSGEQDGTAGMGVGGAELGAAERERLERERGALKAENSRLKGENERLKGESEAQKREIKRLRSRVDRARTHLIAASRFLLRRVLLTGRVRVLNIKSAVPSEEHGCNHFSCPLKFGSPRQLIHARHPRDLFGDAILLRMSANVLFDICTFCRQGHVEKIMRPCVPTFSASKDLNPRRQCEPVGQSLNGPAAEGEAWTWFGKQGDYVTQVKGSAPLHNLPQLVSRYKHLRGPDWVVQVRPSPRHVGGAQHFYVYWECRESPTGAEEEEEVHNLGEEIVGAADVGLDEQTRIEAAGGLVLLGISASHL
ncbi:hypothetical protein QBC42DRAFT_253500 [Cladorrhinum samala]|uniref:Uncharacterized protein n=1 Tax=Cladorrhinum samala TaxID=585594 RepID=A0AAV9HKC1_9PEZI|nr:hypothetical protein QBC42DRAFT_253500 [Cladorrhinum samala]